MPPALPFWCAFAVTLVLLVVSLWTGWQRRRRVHLAVAPCALVALAVTIVLTEQLMAHYDFPADIKAIHLPCAKAGGLLALPVIATGVWLWRRPNARVWHRAAVLVWLVAVLVATGTGLWMFANGTTKAG
jgi:hypothetical protein